jgi:DNA invertase Pin-like site-specific DNA recombinase
MNNRTVCYARVSTLDQSSGLESQVRVLKEYCEKNSIMDVEFFTDEGVSGTKSSRPALDRMMNAVEAGGISTIIVYSFSRFARSTTHLLNALSFFKSKGVQFVSLTEKIDTNSPVGIAIFSILASISQLERDLIADRVRNGLRNARAKGIHIGRVKTRPSELIRRLLQSGMSHRKIAATLKISHGSVSLEKAELKRENEKAKLALLAEEHKKKEAGLQVLDESSPW